MSDGASDKGGFGNGFALGIGLAVVQLFVTGTIEWAANNRQPIGVGMKFFGLIQLIYVVPLYVFLKRHQPPAATGLAAAAGFIALINVSCAKIIG